MKNWNLKSWKSNSNILRSVFDPVGLKNKIDELKKEQQSDGFWQDMKAAERVGKELKYFEDKFEGIKNF